jgi:hypothetical protein
VIRTVGGKDQRCKSRFRLWPERQRATSSTAHHKAEKYNEKAIFYKRCYLTCAKLMTVAAALVPVTINLAQAKAGPYSDKDRAVQDKLLVERIEVAIAQERMKTITMRTTNPQIEHDGNSAANQAAGIPKP